MFNACSADAVTVSPAAASITANNLFIYKLYFQESERVMQAETCITLWIFILRYNSLANNYFLAADDVHTGRKVLDLFGRSGLNQKHTLNIVDI